jgi:hypothetical protein
LKHFTTPEFWEYYRQLPIEIQEVVDKNYELLKADPKHHHCTSSKLAIYGV